MILNDLEWLFCVKYRCSDEAVKHVGYVLAFEHEIYDYLKQTKTHSQQH